MSLYKAIKHGKEKRQHYRHSKSFDKSCRNHGGCPYCENGRAYLAKKRAPASEDIDMHNLEQAKADAEELASQALKGLIREALAQGPGFAKDIASRIGERADGRFVRLLHEMEDDMEVSFSWIRGYRL